MLQQVTRKPANVQPKPATVRIFSPTDTLPPVLADMTKDEIWQHIRAARRLLEAHRDTARNGNPEAERYYFFIPEVAADMANARYTLSIMFAELARRSEKVNA